VSSLRTRVAAWAAVMRIMGDLSNDEGHCTMAYSGLPRERLIFNRQRKCSSERAA
jgi:hypothetical protein